MEIKTVPAGRFAWGDTTLHYAVKAEGADELTLPEKCPDGVEARITGLRRTGDSVEADLAVEIRDGKFV